MQKIIKESRETCHWRVRDYCREIANAFSAFETAELKIGKAWENLFLAALLIRIVAQENHSLLNTDFWQQEKPDPQYTLGWNDFAEGKTKPVEVKDASKYLEYIPEKRCKHISVYRPEIATFEKYDIFLVVWDEEGQRSITGYQLKEGMGEPKKGPLPTSLVQKSYVIKGKPSKKEDEKDEESGWHYVGKESISSFFGHSGGNWLPLIWEAMLKKVESA
jgi:hypothetical protein